MSNSLEYMHIKPDEFQQLIIETELKYPFLKHSRKGVLSILGVVTKSSCFLPTKPTPVISSLQYLRAVLSPSIDREDFVFVLAALKAPLGMKSGKLRHTFKVFPDQMAAGWAPFTIATSEDAEKLIYAMGDAVEPTKAERANAQSCGNKLIKNYEIYMKAVSLWREKQEGRSFAQSKQNFSIPDRDYQQALKLLAEWGLIQQRQTVRPRSFTLSEENVAYVEERAVKENQRPNTVLNEIVDDARVNKK